MKELPKVYVNDHGKTFKNNSTQCLVSTKTVKDMSTSFTEEKVNNISNVNNSTIDSKIDSLFRSDSYVSGIVVNIDTNSGTYQKRIISRNKYSIITIDGEIIPIELIKDISTVN